MLELMKLADSILKTVIVNLRREMENIFKKKKKETSRGKKI